MPYWKSAPNVLPGIISLGQYRWDPVPHDGRPQTFVTGMRTMTTAGDVHTQVGMAAHIYLATASMEDEYFYSADSELLVVPQEGRLRFCTELGIIDLEPKEIAILPRGLVYRVEVIEGPARGFVCENYGQKLELPGRGPIGANCMANRATSRRPSPRSRIATSRAASPSSGAGSSTPRKSTTRRSTSSPGTAITRR
jgi:homogentisate 1,2-dioxygenase